MAKFYDTLIGEYIQNPWARWLSLDKLANKYFDYEMMSYKEITNNKKLNFEEVELKVAADYSWEDVYMTNELYLKQDKKWITNNKILNDIEIPLIDVLKDMEISWVRIDRDILKWIWILLENEVSRLEKEIFSLAWEEFNIKSPKQVWEILFTKLELPKWKRTKTWWSVNSEVLLNLKDEFPIAQDIVDYRHFSKLLSTYVEWLLKLLDENDLVHTSYNSTVTSTWRLSSTKPNLQNIPVWEWIASEIRWAFVSRWDNWKILALDYSQVEVRLLAIMSWDKNLLDAFKNWLDIHSRTWEFIFWEKEISSSQRKIAKAVNFWVIYGISAFWLNKMINSWVKEAWVYIRKFYENYPEVKSFFDTTIRNAEENGYVETMFWRKRFINGINDRNALIKKTAEREAINMPIQGSSADIIKIAMIRVANFMKKNKLKSKMIMQVHDELVFDVFPGEEVKLKKEVKKIMENILEDIPIELKVDIWFWDNWREAK